MDDPENKTKKISLLKDQLDAGEISGTVKKIIDKNNFILKASEDTVKKDGIYYYVTADGKTIGTARPRTFTVAISGVDTSKLFQGDSFTSNVMLAGAYELKIPHSTSVQRLRKFEILKPLDETGFKKYLDGGNILYRYVKKADGYAKCEKCGGKGNIPNPDYKKGRLAAKSIDCPDCMGGRIKQYKIVKVEVKAPRKRIASR